MRCFPNKLGEYQAETFKQIYNLDLLMPDEHVLRMPSDKNPKIALTWASEGRRRKGRPRETWRRTVNKEREHLGFRTWRQAEVAARADKVA